MEFDTITSPHSERPNSVARSMLWVILALIPGIAAMIWHFGPGVLINMILAVCTAVIAEVLVMKLRARPALPAISDLSAVVTAILLAITLPPLLPWWLTVMGTAFAIIVVKQLYGGLGYNPFNPAMAAYVLLLISYPIDMTAWQAPAALSAHSLGWLDTLRAIGLGTLPEGITWDTMSAATPLDDMRSSLDLGQNMEQIQRNPLWGHLGGQGWEVAASLYLLGGLVLLTKRIISWHIPVSLLGTLLLVSSLFHLVDPQHYPSGWFHLFSGGALLGAFFIATDPVTACTTKKGQLIYGACIACLIYIIRTWGGYPDAVAFAVLLMNMAAPTIDYYTQPRVFGTGGKKNG